MKDFRLFDIADFVMDEDFIRWVRLQQSADNQFWENWLVRNPHKHLIVAEARRILESIGFDQDAVAPEIIEAEISQVLTAIHNESTVPVLVAGEQQQKRSISFRWRWAAAAAVLVVSLGTAMLIFPGKVQPKPVRFDYAAITSDRHLIEKVNDTKSVMTVDLPDGSAIRLASNSRISYENRMDTFSTRDVYLSGQAFFNVMKNPERPFRVFANEIVAKVLGTTFTIKSFEKDTDVQVTVNTGKVSVYSQGQTTVKEAGTANNKMDGYIVSPNQQLVYEKPTREFRKILLENPELIVPADASKRASNDDDASFGNALENLCHNYGITVNYDIGTFKDCTIHGDFSKGGFYRNLEIICKTIGAHYEIIEGQIYVQGKGCPPEPKEKKPVN